jgi:hypothetical protein
MDIKLLLREIVDGKDETSWPRPALQALCRDTLAEIKRLEADYLSLRHTRDLLHSENVNLLNDRNSRTHQTPMYLAGAIEVKLAADGSVILKIAPR